MRWEWWEECFVATDFITEIELDIEDSNNWLLSNLEQAPANKYCSWFTESALFLFIFFQEFRFKQPSELEVFSRAELAGLQTTTRASKFVKPIPELSNH